MKMLRGLVFPILMLALTGLTLAKYDRIKKFKANSQSFTVEVEGDQIEVERIKSILQDMTFQSVIEDCIDERRHRLTLRCPPEKLSFLLSRAGVARRE